MAFARARLIRALGAVGLGWLLLMLNGWTIGIGTSLIAGVLVLFAERMIREWLIPRWRAVLLKVPDINKSRWEGFSPDSPSPNEPNALMEVSQTGTRIKAKVYRKVKDGERLFEYEGTLLSGQLVLTWEEPKAAGFIVGAMVLALSYDLKKLEGKSTCFHHGKGYVVSTGRIYKRI